MTQVRADGKPEKCPFCGGEGTRYPMCCVGRTIAFVCKRGHEVKAERKPRCCPRCNVMEMNGAPVLAEHFE